MVISKLDAARIQLDAAIDHFLVATTFVPLLSLAPQKTYLLGYLTFLDNKARLSSCMTGIKILTTKQFRKLSSPGKLQAWAEIGQNMPMTTPILNLISQNEIA